MYTNKQLLELIEKHAPATNDDPRDAAEKLDAWGEDESNPQYILGCTATHLLKAAVAGDIDLNELALQVLKGRGQA